MRFSEFKVINEITTPIDSILGMANQLTGTDDSTDDSKNSSFISNTLGKIGGFLHPSKTNNPNLAVIQDPNFTNKLNKIANELGVKSADLLTIMNFESRVDPTKYNTNGSGAVGLIQFMPDTAAALGTSTTKLAKMSAVEQLDYVYLYYKQYIKPGASLGDLYLATFYPAALNKSDNFVIGRQGASGVRGAIYSQNAAALDINKDGVITVGDVRSAIKS